MISDLQELDELLRIHINKHFSLIHPKQKYGKNWFKGTPIYILRTDDINENKESGNKKLIFFSKKDIEKVLEVYKNNKKANINEPNIEIYNLENYLLDLEKSSLSAIKKSSFFPPYKSYKTISEDLEYRNSESSENKKIKKIFVEKMKSAQRFCKGVIWLVTSDTLPSEENSW